MNRYIFPVFSVLILACMARAQPMQRQHVTAELISEMETISPGQTFWLALRLNMDKHWHTYWRNPGDAGLETQIEWHLPQGFQASEIQWPAPARFEDPPLVTFGYEDEVFLLTQIHVAPSIHPGKTATIEAQVDWLECKEACLPGEVNFRLMLPVAETAKPADNRRDMFAKARAKLPLPTDDWQANASANDSLLII